MTEEVKDKCYFCWKEILSLSDKKETEVRFETTFPKPGVIVKKVIGHVKCVRNHERSKQKKINEVKRLAKENRTWIYEGVKYKKTHGYIYIQLGKKWIQEHRLVAENILGRELTRKESVHHIDFDKTNNSPESLAVFETHAAHQKFHTELNQYGYVTNPMKRRLDERRLA